MALCRGLRRGASRSDNTSAGVSLAMGGLVFDELFESGVDLVHERLHEAGGGQVQVRRGFCVEAEGVGEGA